jgi:flagellin
MTRINTNVSSLVAQNTLGRSNASLEQALNRLSTGLRINTGKDDPAGLIASENLRSDITSIKKAISNTDRANQVIATADSALGQVSSLLNDIRGLVTESANEGALSSEQVKANQLQIDSSLEALNRIAQTTTFQGRRLLDGSLDFVTTAGTNFGNVSDLKIDQANLGATGSVSVAVNVTTAATKAQVDVANIPAVSGTLVAATANVSVTNSATQATGTVTVDTTNSATITLSAQGGGVASGAEGNGVKSLVIVDGNSEGVTYDASSNTITATVDITGGNNTVADLVSVLNTSTDFNAVAASGGTDAILATNTGSGTLSGGRDAGSATIHVTAAAAGSRYNGVTVSIDDDATIANNSAVATVNGSGNIVVGVNGTVTKQAIADAINALDGYNASVTASSGDANAISSADFGAAFTGTLAGGSGTSGLLEDVVLELGGTTGTEVLSFGAGTSIDDLINGVNQVEDATGVHATASGTTLQLTSVGYGSKALVDLRVISEGSGSTPAGTFTTAIGSQSRDSGTDIVASVNGVSGNADGNSLSINTATLDLSATLAAGFTGTANFDITGGGALFQIGPDVVSNQQVRLGVSSVNTAKLGGASGKLFQLGSGGTADLASDPTTAASIVDEAINQITSLRGRLGAFQRTSLETNKEALNDTLVNLTDAESSIRDADFAAETAALTRAQILVQSGTTVLQVANQNPQNVLALLR